MKITVLIENTTRSELLCEHGLSVLIENKEKKILLDAGTTDKFLENARNMKLDLMDVDMCVLSHGHYDHSGGFYTYLQTNSMVNIYAMEKFDGEYLSSNGGMHGIGVPKDTIKEFGHRFIKVSEVTKIDEGVYLVPHTTKGLEKIGERTGHFKKVDSEILPDDFAHEMSLVIDNGDGLMIFNSCSHGGFCNIIREVKEFFGDRSINAFVGGLHMKGMKDGVEYCTFSDEQITEIAVTMEQEKIKKIYTGHCTGEAGFEKVRLACGDERVEKLYTGKTIYED